LECMGVEKLEVIGVEKLEPEGDCAGDANVENVEA
jgi:hypothetical protein